MKDKFSSFAEVVNGKTPSRAEQTNLGHPVLKIKDVNDFGDFVGVFDSFVDEKFARVFHERCIRAGDILVLNAAHNPDYVGSKIYKAEGEVVGSLATGEWLIVRPKFKKLDSSFAYHWLNWPKTRVAVRNLVKGIHLYPKDVANMDVSFPFFDHQGQIGAVLDKADALRQKRRQAINKLDTLLQSIFIDMFGDPVINPKNWGVRKLSWLGTLERGKSKHRPRNAPELLGGKHPLIQTGDVANANGYVRTYTQTYSDIGLQQSRMWPAGTLCITIAANIGKSAILTFDACFPDSLVGFTPNELTTTEFIQYWLSFRQRELEDTAPESAQKNINLKRLRELDVPLPPRGDQVRFSDMVKKTEALKRQLAEAASKSDTLFASLQQRSFTDWLSQGDIVLSTRKQCCDTECI